MLEYTLKKFIKRGAKKRETKETKQKSYSSNIEQLCCAFDTADY